MAIDDSKEGELSPEESALAKKFFVALGFVIIAIIIVALESFMSLPYVLLGVITMGVILILRIHSNFGKRIEATANAK